MTEATTLQQHLEKAYMLFGKAQKLTVDRAARRILHEINELISAMEEFQLYGLDYDEAEVGTKLRYYEKQLQLIEEKRDSMLLRSFRQMVSKSDDKLGSLTQNLDDEKFMVNWMKEHNYEFCSYSKQEALEKLDEIGVEAAVEEEDPLGINLDLWCLKVRKNE